jgi:hypothetical protein
VCDLFTFSSKVYKQFHNSIKEHLNEKRKEKNQAPTGFHPGTSGLKTHRLTAWTVVSCVVWDFVNEILCQHLLCNVRRQKSLVCLFVCFVL